MSKLSNRAVKAITVLAAGGEFVCRLERDSYTGREQFRYRLLNVSRRVVPGIGLSAYYEIKDSFLVPVAGGTSVSSYYGLRAGWAA